MYFFFVFFVFLARVTSQRLLFLLGTLVSWVVSMMVTGYEYELFKFPLLTLISSIKPTSISYVYINYYQLFIIMVFVITVICFWCTIVICWPICPVTRPSVVSGAVLGKIKTFVLKFSDIWIVLLMKQYTPRRYQNVIMVASTVCFDWPFRLGSQARESEAYTYCKGTWIVPATTMGSIR